MSMQLMTRTERRIAAEALSQLLAGESDMTEAQHRAAVSAHAKLMAPDPAKKLRDCLAVAFNAFAHDDYGEAVWSQSLIAKTRRILKATGG